MTLQRKIMLYILGTTFLLFAVLYYISDNTLLENYKRLESSNLQESMKQNLLAYYDEFTNLGAIAINYAGWDDTYVFIDRPSIPPADDPYLTINYTDSLFTSSRLNLVMLMNNEKQVYFGKAFDYARNRPLAYPQAWIDTMMKEHPGFFEQPDILARKQGLLVINGQPLIAASYPILTSNNEGPVHGTLLFVRYLDLNYTNYISKKTDMHLKFSVVDPSFIPPSDAVQVSLSGDRNTLFWTKSDQAATKGFCLLTDIENRPALIMEFEKPRELYHQAQKSTAFYMFYLFLSGVFFIIVIRFLLSRTLFWRLQRTVDLMNEIKNKHDLTIRIRGIGQDEISKLEQSFNHMMDSLQQTQHEVQYQAEHDPLSGLKNRKMFYRYLDKHIIQSERNQTKFAVLFIDLDRFKLINDTMGHRTGDQLIIGIAQRLRQCIGKADFLCRMGGDEFCIITSGEVHSIQVEHLAQRVQESIREPFDLDGFQTSVSASIGISLYPEDGLDAESLLHNSDMAMLDVKETGKNNFRRFTTAVDVTRTRRLRIEQYLKHAIARDELFMEYQPKLDLATKRVTGVEALLRWSNPVLGRVSPQEFIPICESYGLINEIGEWVIRSVCRQCIAWQHQCPEKSLTVAINISGVQLLQPDFVERTRMICLEENVDPRHLELEVTESFAIEKFDEVVDIFSRLHKLGFTISIDDFGAGYSSMKYLCQLPIQCMKLDKTLIDHLNDNPRSQVIVSTLIEMAHRLNMTVIAEGVEEEGQLQTLQSYDCDQIQGYLISKPVEAGKIPVLLSPSGQ